MARLKNKYLLLLIFAWLGIASLLTLWPFNFFQKNVVTSTTGGGLHFESPSMAYISQAPINIGKLKKFSIAMEVKSDITSIDIDGIIFGNCIDYDNYNFIMVQVREYFEFAINVNGISHLILVEGMFEKDNPVWIEVIYDGNNLTFLKNGSVKNITAIGNIDFSDWNSSYPFVFANGGDGRNPWCGTFFSFDIFDNAVTLTERKQLETAKEMVSPIISLSAYAQQTGLYQSEGEISASSIIIPARFNPPGKSLFISLYNSTEWEHVDYMDFILNILLFIPFGFLLPLLLKKYTRRYYFSFFVTILAGFLLTISIETLQSFLPTRFTSIIDVISNTLGAIAGAIVITFALIRKSSNMQRKEYYEQVAKLVKDRDSF